MFANRPYLLREIFGGFSSQSGYESTLENMDDIPEGDTLHKWTHLKSLLESSLSKPTKGSKVVLGMSDSILAGAIIDTVSIECDASRSAQELISGVFNANDLTEAQLGLGHSY